jgi:transglutaminase-like putative cysteine protease
MAQSTTQSGIIPLSQAIHKYFELSMYLLVLMGFGTLASTGGLDLPTLALVGAALAYRGYLLAERRKLVISERWTTPLTIAYVVFYAADYFVISRAFLAATVHLVVFAVVVRTFSLRRDRDYTTLAVLAFLMVLASAVLTVDSVFLFFFAGFMLLAVATFILMEMKRSGKSATYQAQHSRDAHEHRHLAFSLSRIVPSLVALILIGAAGIFFLLPRMSAGYLGGYASASDLSTGFSDRVQLGRIGQIQQSNAVVMHIQIDGDKQGLYELHWRGVSLENFDGKNWSNPRTQYPLQRAGDGTFTVPLFSQGVPEANRIRYASAGPVKTRLIHYRVLMEPIGTGVFFLAPWARQIKGAYRGVSLDSGGAVYDLDAQHVVNLYEAESDISKPSPAQLRAAAASPPGYAQAYLQLPALDPRIAPLAAQITASASNNYDKAAALERYLNTHYTYTLQLPRGPVSDPLANFLFVRKQGHCEYFASSMAVLLRTLGIPARVVNGFRSEEFNDVTGNYVVRAKNAHSWVEAYFPGYGWVTFDPTPGGEIGTPQGWGRALLYLDAAESFWREWVISYDASHQFVLGKAAVGETRNGWERLRAWGQERYARLMTWVRHGQRGAEKAPVRWFVGAFALGVFLLLLGNAGRMVRLMRLRRLTSHPEKSPGEAAAMWYQRMAKYLARRGLKKSASQTAQEFVRLIADERLRQPVGRFTDAYESARFGSSPEDARRLAELYEEVELASKK